MRTGFRRMVNGWASKPAPARGGLLHPNEAEQRAMGKVNDPGPF
jgi:hypothetical protein